MNSPDTQPEVVTAVVNHRISLAESVGELQQHLQKVLGPVAAKYNFALEAFGEDVQFADCMGHSKKDKGPKKGKIILSEAFHSS